MTRRKSELRREVAARKAAIRAKLAERRPPKRRRRWPWLLLLLLLLLIRCEEPPIRPTGPASVGTRAPQSVASTAPPSAAPKRAKPRRERLRGIKVAERTAYARGAARPAPWLPALRLQVAARAPRIARCFEGQGEPGAVEWVTTVDPTTGVTADHAFEVIGGGVTLGKPLKACLVAALSTPPYGLEGGEGAARISLLIEF